MAAQAASAIRTVNVHEAKTQFSRLIDAAHAGESILVAKDGKPWVLRGRLQLPATDVLLAPLPPEELDGLDAALPR
ncbi:type II toxin-antitoxin system Phd/YefM family antitoxin [Synechococcus sp. BA-132 BA5]|uniref:type II toxin-antitoxin system Phd/YefM family antitoxin n=1 Tax=Synechococcus sp. BA-132 BA5 TaxID=3110252 RepID=UPI002B1F2BC4|nr:type II toxin-antitoxin system prevent-host-death family antitoxin [Synechococcus sp. BA-132 BA5]MEA5414480.1 type II toxin-antitoxin system prevent-host-death family antitoxin [Synechococcus sp. BA-132 BA5]